MKKMFRYFGLLFIAAGTLSSTASLQARSLIDPTIHFDSGSSEIRKSDLVILQDTVSIFKTTPADSKLKIVGHCDAIESKKKGDQLARQRAQAAKDFLVNAGIDPNRLVIEAFGSIRPVATNETDQGRYLNRRVEFVFIPASKEPETRPK